MATARMSPAASLLRSSRLFSIPPPLNPPTSLASGTATLPYPTHAAIETPLSSWDRGEWGFKRSLPLKSTTKTGTTTIRVQDGIDSIEHITDFESAADHVLTLRKWRELNLPIRFIKRSNRDDSMSVFEAKLDNISSTASSAQRRWRYNGPWLAGQTGLEFDTLLKRVQDRKPEFEKYVRARLNAGRTVSRRQEAIDTGIDLTRGEALGVSNEEFHEHMLYLRATPSAFGPLIAAFLDLPKGPKGTTSTASLKDGFVYGRTTVAAEAYSEIGPPRTHPSAGISYLRSGAHIANHPTFGPQPLSPPVVARVIRPAIRRKPGEVGIAGFVASSSASATLLGPLNTKPWQPTRGGVKVVASPRTAAVDSGGRIILSAGNAPKDLQRVYGLAEETKQREVPKVAATRLQSMPPLDGKFTRETKPFYDTLENALRLNEDGDHI